MADLLRYTGPGAYTPLEGESPTRICMHAAPYDNRLWQATGALIADTRGNNVMAWVTATSGTDVSIFKPAFFGVELPDLGPMPRESFTPGAYWWKHEFLHRRAMSDYDRLMRELEALEAAHRALASDDSPTRKVGARAQGGFAEVRHAIPMLSLGNAFEQAGDSERERDDD